MSSSRESGRFGDNAKVHMLNVYHRWHANCIALRRPTPPGGDRWALKLPLKLALKCELKFCWPLEMVWALTWAMKRRSVLTLKCIL